MGIGPEEKGWGHRHAQLTHRHVGARSNKGVGHGVYELAAHTEVTQLNLPARIHKDIGGLDIWVAEGMCKNTHLHNVSSDNPTKGWEVSHCERVFD